MNDKSTLFLASAAPSMYEIIFGTIIGAVVWFIVGIFLWHAYCRVVQWWEETDDEEKKETIKRTVKGKKTPRKRKRKVVTVDKDSDDEEEDEDNQEEK